MASFLGAFPYLFPQRYIPDKGLLARTGQILLRQYLVICGTVSITKRQNQCYFTQIAAATLALS